MKERLGANAVPIQINWGTEEDFKGVIDLIQMKAILWDEASLGMNFELVDIPAELQATAKRNIASRSG